LVKILETAENDFIKMNGFRVFWAKVKFAKIVATKARRRKEEKNILATNEHELARIN